MKVWQIEAMSFELNAGVDQDDGLLDGGNQEVPIRLVAQVAWVNQGRVPGKFWWKFYLEMNIEHRHRRNVTTYFFLLLLFD